MKLTSITESGTGYSDGLPRYWATVVEDDGAPDLIGRYLQGRMPVAYVTQDHRSEAAAEREAANYIKRHGK